MVGVVSLFHNFWILTNRQIFDGYSSNIELINDVRLSDHSVGWSIENMKPHNYGTFILFVLLILAGLISMLKAQEKETRDEKIEEARTL